MSAPDGDLERQTRHHRGPLRGMFAVVIWALVLLVILGFWVVGRGGDPEGAEVQVQSGIGEVDGDDVNPVSANNDAAEERDLDPVIGEEADPVAVEVPSLRVEHPQDGTDDTVNPLTGPSDVAVPLDPIAEDTAESEEEPVPTE